MLVEKGKTNKFERSSSSSRSSYAPKFKI